MVMNLTVLATSCPNAESQLEYARSKEVRGAHLSSSGDDNHFCLVLRWCPGIPVTRLRDVWVAATQQAGSAGEIRVNALRKPWQTAGSSSTRGRRSRQSRRRRRNRKTRRRRLSCCKVRCGVHEEAQK